MIDLYTAFNWFYPSEVSPLMDDKQEQARRVKQIIEADGLAASHLAWESKIDRGKLQGFLAGTGELCGAESEQLLEFLEADPTDPRYAGSLALKANLLVCEANSQHFVAHVVPYVIEREVLTGTFVCIGDREFIATAAHGIRSNRPEVMLVGNSETGQEHVNLDVMQLGFDEDRSKDIGFIEVKRGTASRMRHATIGLERIRNLGCGRPGQRAMLFGYPWAHRHVEGTESEPVFVLGGMLYPSYALDVDGGQRCLHRPHCQANLLIFFCPTMCGRRC